MSFAQEGTIITERFEADGERWTALKPKALPKDQPLFTLVRCQGGELIVFQGKPAPSSPRILWFDPGDANWEEMPELAESSSDATPARVGSTRVLWTSDIARNYYLIEDGADQWTSGPKPTNKESTVQTTGDRLLVQVGPGSKDLSLLDPKAYAATEDPAG